MLSVFTSNAHGSGFKESGIKEADFFNFERAKSYWFDIKGRAELENEYEKCISGPFGSWEKDFIKDSQSAIEDIEGYGDAEAIKACYDLQMTYNVFDRMYFIWRQGRSLRPEPFNQNTRAIACAAMGTANVFTGECNDMPDWRTPEWQAEDLKVLQRFQEWKASRTRQE